MKKVKLSQEGENANPKCLPNKVLIDELRDRGFGGELKKPCFLRINGRKYAFVSAGIKII